jgi:hypothetical protein
LHKASTENPAPPAWANLEKLHFHIQILYLTCIDFGRCTGDLFASNEQTLNDLLKRKSSWKVAAFDFSPSSFLRNYSSTLDLNRSNLFFRVALVVHQPQGMAARDKVPKHRCMSLNAFI